LPEKTKHMTDQTDPLKALPLALVRLGHDTGELDGLFVPRPEAALKAVAAEGGAIGNQKHASVAAPGPMNFQGGPMLMAGRWGLRLSQAGPRWRRGW
jgi:hypothetical protein